MKLYYTEEINGVANQVVYSDGLTSTEASRKKISKVTFVVSGRQGNYIELWLEKERLALIRDDFVNLVSEVPKKEFELDLELEVGKTVKTAIRCGATATNVKVLYEYEEI